MQPDDIEIEGSKQRSDRELQPCWTAPRAKIYSIETTQTDMGTHYHAGDGVSYGCLS
jgi:hypothetical protein